MKTYILPLALLGASSLLALQPKPSLNCDASRHGDNRRANFCEMREQTVSAAGGPITVDSRPNGGISIKGWDRTDVLVRSQVRTSAATDAEARDLARQVVVQATGAQIKSEGPTHDNDHQWSISYEVFVPSRSAVSLQTVNGGISIADVTGDLEFQSVNGGVSLANVGGKVHGQTTNGGVSIHLANQWQGEGMDVKTTNGGVTLHVAQNFSAQLEVQTRNGGIHSDLPMVPAPSPRDRHVAATLGTGGPTVHLTTTNGGVSITTGTGGSKVKRL